MANLNLYYGTMESGKTTKLLQDHYNYERHEISTVVFKPACDTKGGDNVVSRQGECIKVDALVGETDSFLRDHLYQLIDGKRLILVDEAEFLTVEQINELWFIAHYLNIPVNAYSLKNNFVGNLFQGSAQLLSRADGKYELTVSCMCGEIAMFNARKVNGVFVSEGKETVIDGAHDEVQYIPLCGDCYLQLVENNRISEFKRIRFKKD